MSRKRKKRSSQSKDQFVDLAYEAIQEAELEEDRKGVIEEVIDALINATDLPLVAEVIAEQLTSQDVIERTAEKHFIKEEELRTSRTATPDLYQDYKETLPPPHDISSTITDEEEEEEEEMKEKENENNNSDNNKKENHHHLPKKIHFNYYDEISDYLWRFFRLLILACLVALIYQYYQHNSTYFSFLFS